MPQKIPFPFLNGPDARVNRSAIFSSPANTSPPRSDGVISAEAAGKNVKEAQLAVIGSWKDDPYMEEELKEIMRQRGRPMPEDES